MRRKFQRHCLAAGWILWSLGAAAQSDEELIRQLEDSLETGTSLPGESVPQATPPTAAAASTPQAAASGASAAAPSTSTSSSPQGLEGLGTSSSYSAAEPYVEPNEPGGHLKPSEKFSRIPLKPRMSDSNWQRWAGPLIEKNYRVRRNDSLWGISEKLFGNPYLWPKVWQLNAQIPNPHVISTGLELAFTPGNPNSAPVLAFKTFPGTSTDLMPMVTTQRKLSFMEFLDENLRAQILSSQPPFRYFFFDEKPQAVGKVPRPENTLRLFHETGDEFMAKNLEDGKYSLMRVSPVKGKFYNAYKVQWVGKVEVQAKRARITQAFTEIRVGDEIVARDFSISPLALYEQRLGKEARGDTQIIPIQEGYETLASENMLVGLRFPGIDQGPRAGALLTVSQGAQRIATLLILSRDKRLGTAWVVESARELDSKNDEID